MYDIMFSHVMQGNQKLNSKSSNKTHGNTLKVIALDEFIKVHAQHFKNKNKMLSKNKLLYYLYNVFFVFRIVRA